MTGTEVSYRVKKARLFPVNVGRNIAREAATTHFVFANDLELYPNPGFIEDFLEMVKKDTKYSEKVIVKPVLVHKCTKIDPQFQSSPSVWVLPHFELDENVKKLPKTKYELVQLLKSNQAIPFHFHLCTLCHAIPKLEEWEAENSDGNAKLILIESVYNPLI